MSEIIAALLGGLIAIIGYFAIIETINDDWIVENCKLPKFRSRR